MKAIWNSQLIAESDKTVVVEQNHYFPPESVNMSLLKKSGDRYQCAWKGLADYYDVVVDGAVNHNAAWAYLEPTEKAQNIKGYFAFWMGVEVK
ncbi:MAG: hypothetical protein A3D65_04495 [Candidatus Lloydbacteria bacterium RIFCSPHIGHO2_02_FULL_50_13]|uniref:DUF427 domain-containing protein n=1 Tax=Candidatus Lloydbacteria bacterium RIFCSPHIGHO2_02_FULL_50_13 TaxID=1798661 RepID=A0A1G2DDE4_9BACT|nr:MAG: hypothetical protein A3D65_04495 [Candidatus Lloydbacteria bacterium RIFCSPHIGHO2_02_FULL_50_13]